MSNSNQFKPIRAVAILLILSAVLTGCVTVSDGDNAQFITRDEVYDYAKHLNKTDLNIKNRLNSLEDAQSNLDAQYNELKALYESIGKQNNKVVEIGSIVEKLIVNVDSLSSVANDLKGDIKNIKEQFSTTTYKINNLESVANGLKGDISKGITVINGELNNVKEKIETKTEFLERVSFPYMRVDIAANEKKKLESNVNLIKKMTGVKYVVLRAYAEMDKNHKIEHTLAEERISNVRKYYAELGNIDIRNNVYSVKDKERIVDTIVYYASD